MDGYCRLNLMSIVKDVLECILDYCQLVLIASLQSIQRCGLLNGCLGNYHLENSLGLNLLFAFLFICQEGNLHLLLLMNIVQFCYRKGHLLLGWWEWFGWWVVGSFGLILFLFIRLFLVFFFLDLLGRLIALFSSLLVFITFILILIAFALILILILKVLIILSFFNDFHFLLIISIIIVLSFLLILPSIFSE